jgi:hypothetical protein
LAGKVCTCRHSLALDSHLVGVLDLLALEPPLAQVRASDRRYCLDCLGRPEAVGYGRADTTPVHLPPIPQDPYSSMDSH